MHRAAVALLDGWRKLVDERLEEFRRDFINQPSDYVMNNYPRSGTRSVKAAWACSPQLGPLTVAGLSACAFLLGAILCHLIARNASDALATNPAAPLTRLRMSPRNTGADQGFITVLRDGYSEPLRELRGTVVMTTCDCQPSKKNECEGGKVGLHIAVFVVWSTCVELTNELCVWAGGAGYA